MIHGYQRSSAANEDQDTDEAMNRVLIDAVTRWVWGPWSRIQCKVERMRESRRFGWAGEERLCKVLNEGSFHAARVADALTLVKN